MASFLNALFGGSDQQSNSTPTDMTPAPFKALQGPFADYLSSTLQSGGPTYSGPLTAPMSSNETGLLGQLMTQTDPNNPRGQLLNSTLAGNYLPGQPGANPFFDAAVRAAQRPTLEGLTDTLTKALPGRFTAAGGFVNPQGNSAFDNAAAIATRGAANAIGDIATNMGNTQYQQERQLQQQAIPLSQQEVQTTIQNLQAQALPRLIQENGIDRGIDLFKTQTTQMLQLLATLAGVTQPTIAQTASASGTSTKGIIPGISGLLKPMNVLGGGGGAAPAAEA